MAYWYCDFSTGDTVGNGNTGADWSSPIKTLKELLESTALGAGDNEQVDPDDTVFVRANGTEDPDTLGSLLTLTTRAVAITSPIRIVGVKTGTTNTGAGVVASDYAVNTGDMPVIEVTGAGNDLTFTTADMFDFSFIKFSVNDRINISAPVYLYQCHITCDNILCNNAAVVFIDCDINLGNDADVGSGLGTSSSGRLTVKGGSISNPSTQLYLVRNLSNHAIAKFIGVDMSGLTLSSAICVGSTSTPGGVVKLVNCRFATAYTLLNTPGGNTAYKEVIAIGCYSGTTAATTSQQQYELDCSYGTVVNEDTVVRTGGADDGSTGQFSYKMQTYADSVMPGTGSNLHSPWMSAWVDNTSQTLTVYIVNDGALLTQDECWCEIYTPNSTDAANHIRNVLTNTEDDFNHVSEASTNITTDSSTWVTVNTHKQKFDVTLTPGYVGWAYARVHLAKRQPSGMYNVYVDPIIEVV